MILQTIVGSLVMFPAFYWHTTGREFIACLLIAVLVACCIPSDWREE